MRNKTKVLLAILAGVLLLDIQPVWAGWVITSGNGSKTLITNGKIKTGDPDNNKSWSIIETRKQNMFFVNPQQKTYSEVSFAEWQDLSRRLDEKTNAAYAQAGIQKKSAANPKVEIKKIGNGGKIAGFDTVKYQVFADGKLYQELWVTDDNELMSDYGDPKFLQKWFECLWISDANSKPEQDPAYIRLISSTYTLKHLNCKYRHGHLESRLYDTSRIERKKIPASEFAIPPGYKKVNMEDVMGLGSQSRIGTTTTGKVASGSGSGMATDRHVSSHHEAPEPVENPAVHKSSGIDDLQGLVVKGVKGLKGIFGR